MQICVWCRIKISHYHHASSQCRSQAESFTLADPWHHDPPLLQESVGVCGAVRLRAVCGCVCVCVCVCVGVCGGVCVWFRCGGPGLETTPGGWGWGFWGGGGG